MNSIISEGGAKKGIEFKMINEIVSQIEKIKEMTESHFNIPMKYILLFFSCFLVWNPKYISYINIVDWFPEILRIIVYEFFNIIYSNFVVIILTFSFILLVLLTLADHTSFFRKVLPKSVDHGNGTIVSWNETSAAIRLVSIIRLLFFDIFIYYFAFNVIFNINNFVDNFFILHHIQEKQEWISKNVLLSASLFFLNIVLFLNILSGVYYIMKALFEVKSTDKYSLNSSDINSYIFINSFSTKNSLKEEFKILILKNKYSTKAEFLIVEVKIYEYKIEDDLIESVKKIPHHSRRYKILDKSENLEEIIYYFKVLKRNPYIRNKSNNFHT